MKIAYLTTDDPEDRAGWSGIYFQMGQSLKAGTDKIEPLGPLRSRSASFVQRAASNVFDLVLGPGRYDHGFNLIVCRLRSMYFERKLAGRNVDVVFAPCASTSLAYLHSDPPIAYFTDATCASLQGYYPDTYSFARFSVRERNIVERKALERSLVVICASEWAAESVRSDYGIPSERVYVVPMGANIDKAPAASWVEGRRLSAPVTLLFLGVDWERKGGEIAVAAHRYLRQQGVNSKLVVCGCTPPQSAVSDGIDVVPFLDKRKPEDRLRLDELMRAAHFLILPTRAEAFGCVFCEASAYGLPSLASRTGGVPSAVEHGVNGFLFPYDDSGEGYARCVLDMLGRPEVYEHLTRSSRRLYDDRLNWETWGTSVTAIMHQALNK